MQTKFLLGNMGASLQLVCHLKSGFSPQTWPATFDVLLYVVV